MALILLKKKKEKEKDSLVLFYCPPCYFIHRYLVSRYLERNLSLEDAGLYSQVPLLLELVLSANAPGTIARYTGGWNRWRSWSKSRVGVPHLPAEPLHVALYILELTNTALQNGHGSAVIDTAVYSIRWGHILLLLLQLWEREGGWRDPFSQRSR